MLFRNQTKHIFDVWAICCQFIKWQIYNLPTNWWYVVNPNASHICRDPNVHEVPPNVHLSKVQPNPNTHLAGEMSVECKHQAFTVCAVCVYFKDTFYTHVDRSCCKDGFQCEIYRKSQLRSESFSLLPLCLNSVYLTHVSLFLCDQLFEFIMSFIYAIIFCFLLSLIIFVVVYNSCERSTCIWLTMAMQAVLFAQSFTHLVIQTSLIGI